MAVIIREVKEGSPAARRGVKPGETLAAINGHAIGDVLDYQFYAVTQKAVLALIGASGKPRRVTIRKEEYEDLGLDFDTYLMDRQRSCKNKCIFCFIDQLPKGMRESLYFKDDDDRLSFLFGNYITLTNLSQEEIDRIIRMKISPVNISVHTTDPALRVKMMTNPHAGEALDFLRRLADAGTEINCQLVLCPGINDGEALKQTLADLGALYPSVQCIACVPVGLTRHREGLYPLTAYDKTSAGAVVDEIERFTEAFAREHGRRIAYAADEFYLLAGRPLPPAEYYGEFKQLENGVGLVSLLKQEFFDALSDCGANESPLRVSMATGKGAYPLICSLVDAVKEKWHNADIEVFAIENNFFGEQITVAGLITGQDLIAQLKGKLHGDKLLIPRVMLNAAGDRFLDDVTLPQLEAALGLPVEPVENDGYLLLHAITSGTSDAE